MKDKQFSLKLEIGKILCKHRVLRKCVISEIILRINKQDHMKFKSFCTTKETINLQSEETAYRVGRSLAVNS